MWKLTNHVCRECHGRILSSLGISHNPQQSIVDDGRHVKVSNVYRCADCGLECSQSVSSICACGCKLANGKSAGYKCVKNPDRKPGQQQEILVAYLG